MKYLIFVIISLNLFSCKKEETVSPKSTTDTLIIDNGNVVPTNDKNTLVGSCGLVNLNYTYSSLITTDNSGIIVKIIGSNNQVIKQGVTNQQGIFSISEIPIGTYDIEYSYTFSDRTFSTIRTYHNYVGKGPNPSTTRLSPIISYQPKTRIENINLISGKKDEVSCVINPLGGEDLKKLSIGFLYRLNGSNENYKVIWSVAPYQDSLSPQLKRIRINIQPDWIGKSIQMRLYYATQPYNIILYKNEFTPFSLSGEIKNCMGPLSNEFTINP